MIRNHNTTAMSTDIQLKKSRKKGDKSLAITIKGQLDLLNIEEVLGKIKDVFEKHSPVSLLLEDMNDLDLSGLQLIKAMQNEAQEKKAGFSYRISQSKESSELLGKCGFEQYAKQ